MQQEETLQIVQEVLRGLMMSMQAATDADPEKLLSGLQSTARLDMLRPESRLMLQDLAKFPEQLLKKPSGP